MHNMASCALMCHVIISRKLCGKKCVRRDGIVFVARIAGKSELDNWRMMIILGLSIETVTERSIIRSSRKSLQIRL